MTFLSATIPYEIRPLEQKPGKLFEPQSLLSPPIKAGFKYSTRMVIEDRPTYEKIKDVKRQLAWNALTINLSFGGGKHGVLAVGLEDAEFLAETGQDCNVQASQRAFQTLMANTLKINKKKTISGFIQDEMDFNFLEAAKELLKVQFIKLIKVCSIKELRQGYSKYDNCSLFELLEYVNTKYSSLDDHVLKDIMTRSNDFLIL